MRIKRFHQLVICEKGPVNTAIIDLLKGNIYQVENQLIEKFINGEHEGLELFIEDLENEELIIEVDKTTWIPGVVLGLDEEKNETEDDDEISFLLELEEGVNLPLIEKLFKNFRIFRVNYYGKNRIENFFQGINIVYKEKDFSGCLEMSKFSGKLLKTSEDLYKFNLKYNSCWGKKISVTKDHKVRPCIFSEIITGDLKIDDIGEILVRAQKYWIITKDKVEICKVCELRHVCFDCREIARKSGNNLFASNPNCKYNPFKN